MQQVLSFCIHEGLETSLVNIEPIEFFLEQEEFLTTMQNLVWIQKLDYSLY